MTPPTRTCVGRRTRTRPICGGSRGSPSRTRRWRTKVRKSSPRFALLQTVLNTAPLSRGTESAEETIDERCSACGRRNRLEISSAAEGMREEINFPTVIALRRHHSQVRNRPGTTWVTSHQRTDGRPCLRQGGLAARVERRGAAGRRSGLPVTHSPKEYPACVLVDIAREWRRTERWWPRIAELRERCGVRLWRYRRSLTRLRFLQWCADRFDGACPRIRSGSGEISTWKLEQLMGGRLEFADGSVFKLPAQSS